jgi:hypothetical protein
MATINIENFLDVANKYIKNPDVIIDVYDMTYIWTSAYHSEITGYTKEEQTNMRIAKNSQLVNGDTSQIAEEVMIPNTPFVRKIIITTKTGEKKVADIEGIVIEINNQPYLIGKMTSVSTN